MPISSSSSVSSLPWLLTCWPSLPAGLCSSLAALLSFATFSLHSLNRLLVTITARRSFSPLRDPRPYAVVSSAADAVPTLHHNTGLSRSVVRMAGGWPSSIATRVRAAPSRSATDTTGRRPSCTAAHVRAGSSWRAGAPPSRDRKSVV